MWGENVEIDAAHKEPEDVAAIGRASGEVYLLAKRMGDIFCSLLALIILSPLLLMLSVWIYGDDPKGSPIYIQTRYGKDGKPFKLYKFRSMRKDAEAEQAALLDRNEMSGPAFKIKADPRITWVGRFIRKTSLDELPQFLNVLKGDMSIVGPRPPLPNEVAQYSAYQRQRLCVRPGLTCYWQVHPNRYKVSFEEWVEMDLKYIREQSFWVDVKLIFLTVLAVLRGEGE